MKTIPILLLSFSICWLAGCATTDKVVLDGTTRAPTTNVDVYNNGQVPSRSYKLIAELSYLGPREDELKALTRFLHDAKQLGGSGLIMSSQYAGVKGGGTIFQSTAWVFKGKVIVYESGEAPTENNERNRKAEADLVGHWESVATKGPTISSDVVKMEFDFASDNKVVGTTFSTQAKPYQQKGTYSVEGNQLIITSPEKQSDSISYSLVGDHLVLSIGQDNVTLQRLNKSP